MWKKLLLGGVLAADELDIVHQKHVGRAVFVVKFRRGVVVDGADDLVGKFFTVHVYDVIIREIFMDFKLDGAEKVRFAQARTAPDEQRVISAGWIRRNGLRGCVGKLVGGADDEVFKRKFIIGRRRAPRAGACSTGAGMVSSTSMSKPSNSLNASRKRSL